MKVDKGKFGQSGWGRLQNTTLIDHAEAFFIHHF